MAEAYVLGSIKTDTPSSIAALSKFAFAPQAAVALALEDVGGTDHLVPSGETLRIGKVYVTGSGTSMQLILRKHTVANNTGGDEVCRLLAIAANILYEYDVYFEVDAADYLNAMVAAGTPTVSVMCIGTEA